ncbi:MAG: isochorismatase family protein [Myxococcales bacterium]|nr:isochorismatase family protein [Myxococcales bacterium]
MSAMHLDKSTACLLIIDVQERLAAAMPEAPMAAAVRNTTILIEAARRMGIPVVVSEQYPKGLGPTVAAIGDALNDIDELTRFEKLDFSVCAAEGFAEASARLSAQGRSQWIVTGMETHICVYQSVRALIGAGASVHVPVDGVVSRAKHNYRVGLGIAEACGAQLTSTETIVMDLLGRAEGDDFKAISELIR